MRRWLIGRRASRLRSRGRAGAALCTCLRFARLGERGDGVGDRRGECDRKLLGRVRPLWRLRSRKLLRLKERREVMGNDLDRGGNLAPELEGVRVWIASRDVIRGGVGERCKQKAGCEYGADN